MKSYKVSFTEKIEKILKRVNTIQSTELEELVKDIFRHESSVVVSFLNFQAMNLCRQNESFYQAVVNSNYLLRDGVAIEKFQQLIGVEPGFNLNGTDFIPLLVDEAIKQNRPIILWGTSNHRLELTKKNIQNRGGMVEDTMDGFQSLETYINRLPGTSSNALIILGMGMPKQETLSSELTRDGRRVIVNGGAFIDFTSGEITRAPKIFIKYKLEWLYRLLNEPKRLFKRTIIGGIWFALYASYYIVVNRK